MKQNIKNYRSRFIGCIGLFVVALLFFNTQSAHAGIFDDDEARRAILDLRQQISQLNKTLALQSEQLAQMRQGMLQIQGLVDEQRSELAVLRGENERLVRELSEQQKRQRDLVQTIDARLSKVEPVKINIDGQEASVEQSEKREYEAAMGAFRANDMPKAARLFANFVQVYPRSSYRPASLYWLGNAKYATNDCKGAIGDFRSLIAQYPDHARSSEALLSIANCQVDLKDTKAAKKTFEDVVKQYPQSEAAIAAKDSLMRLK